MQKRFFDIKNLQIFLQVGNYFYHLNVFYSFNTKCIIKLEINVLSYAILKILS